MTSHKVRCNVPVILISVDLVFVTNISIYCNLCVVKENGIISGWGTKLEEELALQDILHKVTVRLIKNTQDCQVAVGDDMIIENSMICVTSPSDNPADSCTGDQGGPLTAAREDGEVVLIGLISFGIGMHRIL